MGIFFVNLIIYSNPTTTIIKKPAMFTIILTAKWLSENCFFMNIRFSHIALVLALSLSPTV